MVKIDTSPNYYLSQLDEDHFFTWAQEIPCVKSIEGGYLYIESKELSEYDLRDLTAIMYRYNMPMEQLQIFCNPSNESWFKDPEKYWYQAVFG